MNNSNLINDTQLVAKAAILAPWNVLLGGITGTASVLRRFEGGRALEATSALNLIKCTGEFGDWYHKVIGELVDNLVLALTYSSEKLDADEIKAIDDLALARSAGDDSLRKEILKKLRVSILKEKARARALGKKMSTSTVKQTVESATQEGVANWQALQ